MLPNNRRRFLKPVLIVAGILVVAGSLVGLRMSQAKKDEPKSDAKVALEFTPADIVLGCCVLRWMELPIERPEFASLRRWFERLVERSGFRKIVMRPLS